MKKVLLSLLALVASTAGALAADIIYSTTTGTYTETNPAGNYAKTWVSADEPTVTITTGANNINVADGGLYTSTYTISVPGGYKITAYSFDGMPSDGATDITVTVGDDDTTFGASGNTLSVTGLSTASTSFTVNGRYLVVSNFIITVEEDTEYVDPLAFLSNNKAYTLTTARGSLGVSNGTLVSTARSFEASTFAIINSDDAYYLWSVAGEAYVSASGALASKYTAPAALSLISLGDGRFQLRFGSNAINVSAGYDAGLVINGYTTLDDGNRFTITEEGDFDPTTAIARLTPATLTYVRDLAAVSQTKAYAITNARGTWKAASTIGTASVNPDDEAQQFALINHDDQWYIYSVAQKGYLRADKSFNLRDPQPVTISETGNAEYPFFFKFDDTHNINVSGSNVLIDNWGTVDAGNSNVLIEAADFDPTEALTAFDEVVTYVTDLTELSNSKLYTIINARGTWNVADGATSMGTAQRDPESENQRFAIIEDGGKYYLYSVAAKKFLRKDNTLGFAQPINITVTENEAYPFFFAFDEEHNINVNSAGTVVIDSWSDVDDGNCNAIIEAAAEFDPTEALEFLNYDAKDLLAKIAHIFLDEDHGTPFHITDDVYNTYANDVELAAAYGCTGDEYMTYLEILGNEASCTKPNDGEYYVIRNVGIGNYIEVQSDGCQWITAKASTPGLASVVKIVERDGHLYISAQGKEFSWVWTGATNYSAFLEDAGKYAHFKLIEPGVVAFAHALGNGEGQYASFLADAYYTAREDSIVAGGKADNEAAWWVFEPVSEVAIPLYGAEHYATLVAPFDLTLNGAVAYRAAAVGEKVSLEEIGAEVPANTPVVIKGDEAYITAAITEGLTALTDDNLLTANMLAANVSGYVLSHSEDTGLSAFYRLSSDGVLAANKAYIADEGGEVKTIAIDLATAVRSLSMSQAGDAPLFNIAGQRVAKAQKGIFVARGKKVVVK